MNSAERSRGAPASPATGAKRSREVTQRVYESRKRRNTLATTRKQTYVELSSPESSLSRKRLQTTNTPKLKPASRESHPKPRPSTGKKSASTLTGKGTPAAASSPESPHHRRKRLQTTYPPKTNPTSGESRPIRPSPGSNRRQHPPVKALPLLQPPEPLKGSEYLLKP